MAEVTRDLKEAGLVVNWLVTVNETFLWPILGQTVHPQKPKLAFAVPNSRLLVTGLGGQRSYNLRYIGYGSTGHLVVLSWQPVFPLVLYTLWAFLGLPCVT